MPNESLTDEIMKMLWNDVVFAATTWGRIQTSFPFGSKVRGYARQETQAAMERVRSRLQSVESELRELRDMKEVRPFPLLVLAEDIHSYADTLMIDCGPCGEKLATAESKELRAFAERIGDILEPMTPRAGDQVMPSQSEERE